MLNAVVRFSEEVGAEEHSGVPAWVYGAIAFVLLIAVLVAVTRFNPDR